MLVGRFVVAAALCSAVGGGCAPAPAGSSGMAFSGTTAADDDDSGDADDDDSDDADTRDAADDDDGDPATDDPASSSEASTSDTPGSTGAPACTPAPDPDPAWLPGALDEVVSSLAVDIGVRSSVAQRAAAAETIADAFDGLGYVAQLHDYGSGTNVFAELAATTAADAPVLVIGAHYDTVVGSPGANDNATGVALVLALARYLREIPCRSRHVMFVAFDQEEIGLVGSDAFARRLVDDAVDVEAVHTIDQMGWDGDGDRGIEVERAAEGLFAFYEGPAGTLIPPVPLTPTGTGSTDHVSFAAYGLPAVGLTEQFASGDTTPHYHEPSDTYATVDLAYLASSTALANLAFGRWVDAS